MNENWTQGEFIPMCGSLVKHVEKKKNWAKDYGYKGCMCHNKVWYVTWIVSSSLNNYNLVLCPKIKRSLYNLHLYFYFEQGHTIDRWWKLQIFFPFFEVAKKFEKAIKKLNKLGDC